MNWLFPLPFLLFLPSFLSFPFLLSFFPSFFLSFFLSSFLPSFLSFFLSLSFVRSFPFLPSSFLLPFFPSSFLLLSFLSFLSFPFFSFLFFSFLPFLSFLFFSFLFLPLLLLPPSLFLGLGVWLVLLVPLFLSAVTISSTLCLSTAHMERSRSPRRLERSPSSPSTRALLPVASSPRDNIPSFLHNSVEKESQRQLLHLLHLQFRHGTNQIPLSLWDQTGKAIPSSMMSRRLMAYLFLEEYKLQHGVEV